jgi:hypothetical protein
MLGAKVIKLAGRRSWDELTWHEFALMIDAQLDGPNAAFDEDGLSEFLCMPVRMPQIEALQIDLRRNAYLPADYGLVPDVSVDYLRALSAQLKSVGYP